MTARRFGVAAGLSPKQARKWIADTAQAAPAAMLFFSVRCFTHADAGGATFAPAPVADAILRQAEQQPRARFNLCAWRK